MKFRLQLFGFDQSAYERPAQKWVCGWASQGAPCHRGPDAKGHCCGGFVCQPKQNGSRWECARSAAAGGACANGPLPDGSCCQSIVTCRPVRSWRARRGLVVAWTLALTAGILCFGLAHWSHFVSPGPLSAAHAPILARGAAAGCAACHTAPHNWMKSLDRDRLADSTLCLKCHQNEAQFHNGNLAMLPHGLPASQLTPPAAAADAPATASSLSVAVSFASSPPAGQIACATCHHEHQDPHGKLASLDNQTCQACHTKQFHSFADGHPEFTRHQFASSHLILFSHATHQTQHFGADKFECAACHTPSSGGRITTLSFESSCARCHSDHFNGKAEPSASGVVLLQIPALDVDTLKSLKVEIGQWPKYDGDPPVRLTPFMRLLLSGDKSDYLAKLPPDLGQLADATDEQVAAVQQLAWAIKTLLNGAGGDVTSLRARLAAGLGREVSPVQFAQLTAGLSSDDVKAASDHWFPQLSTELQKPFEKWNASLRPKKAAPPASAPTPSSPKKAPSDDLFNSSGPAAIPDAFSVLTPLTKPMYADDLFNDSSPATKPSAPSPASAALPASANGGDDLFNDSGAATKPAVSPAAPAKPPPGASGDDLFNGDAPAAPAAKPATPAPVAAPPPAPVPSAPVLSPNGWERNDDKYALIYHPTGHANAFLRAWLELAIPSSATAPTPWQSQLLSADVGGTCTKCHSPAAPGSSIAFAWSSDSPKLLRHDFVKFSHRPHLLEPALQSCSACHAMQGPTDAAASIDPVSGFKFIQKQSCAACHAPTLASDSCLTCHNYHVTPMADAAASADGRGF